MILSSIYFCIISIFLRGSGVSHSYKVHLIVNQSKKDCPTYQEENLLLPQKCSWNYSLIIKIQLKFIMLIKTGAIQTRLISRYLYNLLLYYTLFQHSRCDIIFSVLLYPHSFQGTPLLNCTFFIRTSIYLLKQGMTWNDLKPSKTTWNHPGTMWNEPGNNWHHLKLARK